MENEKKTTAEYGVGKQVVQEHTPVFTTFPLADEAKREMGSGESIPSVSDVDEAKNWVDEKEM